MIHRSFFNLKELSLCHKLKYLNPNIFRYFKPKLFDLTEFIV